MIKAIIWVEEAGEYPSFVKIKYDPVTDVYCALIYSMTSLRSLPDGKYDDNDFWASSIYVAKREAPTIEELFYKIVKCFSPDASFSIRWPK